MSHYTPQMSVEDRAERRLAIAMEIKSGADLFEVAGRHGVSPATASIACRQHCVQVPRQPYPGRLNVYNVLAQLQNTNDKHAKIAKDNKTDQPRVFVIHKEAVEAGMKFPNR